MLNRWLENEPKETLICAVASAVSLVLSITGVLNPVTGALWHNCGSVFVVVNAALLLKDTDSAN